MLLLYLIITYLVGSIPFGLLLSMKVFSQDIRKYGSKNIGATNITRTYGIKFGVVILVLDVLKGIIPVAISNYLLGYSIETSCLFALSSVIGHIFPIYLRFSGGKGVATALGGLMVINAPIALAGVCVWLGIYIIFRISSVASLMGAFFVLIFSIIFLHMPIYSI
ncbi:MAG: glycerol-3-phosphate acyltransferase, partial [Candidatus Xenolissoclinum pacificiensis L6]